MNANPHSAGNSLSMGTSIEASSVGAAAHARLSSCGEGVVQSVFDGAVNILLTTGLVSLVPESAGRGPLNITLRMPAGSPKMSSLGVHVGQKVNVSGPALEVDSGPQVRLGSAKIYSSRVRFALPLLAKKDILANAEAMKKAALLFGNAAGLGGLLTLTEPKGPSEEGVDLNMFASSAINHVLQLEEGFRAEDGEALAKAISGLIGLGPGLTPSCDDMLCGLVFLCLLYADSSGHMVRQSRLVAEVTAAKAAGRTTTLSEEFLRQAASGRANERVADLCTALLTENQRSVERKTRCVLSIGETSGTDIVLGVFLGTKLCMGRRSGLG